jgi:ankyrin repeat protein
MVKQLCEDVDQHRLHILTIHDDKVLQAAAYANKPDLVLRLLEDLPDRHLDKLTRQNHIGNTILHETAISNKSLEVAKKLLEKAPGLLCMRNYVPWRDNAFSDSTLWQSEDVRIFGKENFPLRRRKSETIPPEEEIKPQYYTLPSLHITLVSSPICTHFSSLVNQALIGFRLLFQSI